MKVLMVWLPVLGSDGREDAVRMAGELADPRVTALWDGGKTLGRWYLEKVIARMPDQKDKRVYRGGFVWDAYFLYEPGARWGAERLAPPALTGATILADRWPLLRAFGAWREGEAKKANAIEPARTPY